MIVLDTNVLSELMRPSPSAEVLAWVDSVPMTEMATTAITQAEILYGVRRMPAGKRKDVLTEVVGNVFGQDLRDRVLAFSSEAALEYAILVTERLARGRPISMADAQIAAICRVHRCSLATRNIDDFRDTGVELFNPWVL